MGEQKKTKTLDDELIHKLHGTIYLLETQLKLLKDKDIESKKGGLDVIFRDGIPLNEHFVALKNKYKKEKAELEAQILEIQKNLTEADKETLIVRQKLDLKSSDFNQLNTQYGQHLGQTEKEERE